mgnify:CR=1 FL=1
MPDSTPSIRLNQLLKAEMIMFLNRSINENLFKLEVRNYA